MLQRFGDAKRPHSGTSLARHPFLEVSGPFFSQLHLTLQTIFTPFFVVQFHAFPSQFMFFCLGKEGFGVCSFVSRCPLVSMMLTASCFTCKVHEFRSFSQFSWLVFCLFETMRCVGKQTPVARELQLRNVVWSDEFFFWLREEPTNQNTRIRWVTVDFSFSQLP